MEKGQRKYGLKTMGGIIFLSTAILLCGCARHYTAFQYDNGDDYPSEGLYRIVDRKGSIRYSYTGDSIMVTDGADKEQCAGIHEHTILPLLTELAHTLDGSEDAERMANEAGYSDVRYYLDMPGTAADSLQAGNTWITVDILSFDSGNTDFKRCLNAIKEKDYHAVEWASEAPEQCLVFTKGGKLVAVWCSLFRDGREAVKKVRERLEGLICTAVINGSPTPKSRNEASGRLQDSR